MLTSFLIICLDEFFVNFEIASISWLRENEMKSVTSVFVCNSGKFKLVEYVFL